MVLYATTLFVPGNVIPTLTLTNVNRNINDCICDLIQVSSCHLTCIYFFARLHRWMEGSFEGLALCQLISGLQSPLKVCHQTSVPILKEFAVWYKVWKNQNPRIYQCCYIANKPLRLPINAPSSCIDTTALNFS